MQRENESRAYVECPKPDSRPGGPDYACNTSLERRHRPPLAVRKNVGNARFKLETGAEARDGSSGPRATDTEMEKDMGHGD
jgi:hypothetical protein